MGELILFFQNKCIGSETVYVSYAVIRLFLNVNETVNHFALQICQRKNKYTSPSYTIVTSKYIVHRRIYLIKLLWYDEFQEK